MVIKGLSEELNQLDEWEQNAILMNNTNPLINSSNPYKGLEKVLGYTDNIKVEQGILLLSAELFMKPHENIIYLKHPRFAPSYNHSHDFLELTYSPLTLQKAPILPSYICRLFYLKSVD